MFSTVSSEVKGMSPTLCEMNSSLSTVEFSSNCTQSMAMVGVSAMNTLRMLFATLDNIPPYCGINTSHKLSK